MSKSDLRKKIEAEVRKNATQIKKRIADYESNAAIFSCEKENLVEAYENQWIGVYHGEVSASADTVEGLTEKIKDLGVPLEQTMIRRIDREPKTLIL